MKSRRMLGLGLVGGLCLVLGVAYGIYWEAVLRYRVSTDDAYVSGNIVQITPQISGTVVAIDADDTDFVRAGQPLVKLDPADARVALDESKAELAKTVREVRNLFATTAQLEATVQVRQSDLDKANEDLARRERLAAVGAVSQEEGQHARDAQRSAQAALVASEQQYEANRALVDRTTVNDHPDVQNAAARVRDAYLTYARTVLPAPVSGFVAKRAVQLGQRVSPGTPLMAVVPLDEVWIDANFREPQLADMRVGQPAQVRADLYGRHIMFHGKVVGFGAGTGSAFALLPPQNATGNWIKIVQRVAVRIALDRQELASHPLEVGLSMQVEIDTHDRSAPRLPRITRGERTYSTDVFGSVDATASKEVKQIIAANSAHTSSTASLDHGLHDDGQPGHRLPDQGLPEHRLPDRGPLDRRLPERREREPGRTAEPNQIAGNGVER